MTPQFKLLLILCPSYKISNLNLIKSHLCHRMSSPWTDLSTFLASRDPADVWNVLILTTLKILMLIKGNKTQLKSLPNTLMKSKCNIIFQLHERFSIAEALFVTSFSGPNIDTFSVVTRRGNFYSLMIKHRFCFKQAQLECLLLLLLLLVTAAATAKCYYYYYYYYY